MKRLEVVAHCEHDIGGAGIRCNRALREVLREPMCETSKHGLCGRAMETPREEVRLGRCGNAWETMWIVVGCHRFGCYRDGGGVGLANCGDNFFVVIAVGITEVF